MELRVIEVALRNAVRRGVLDENEVNTAMERMWNAAAAFREAARIPQTAPQEKENKMAEAIEMFNEASTDVVGLLRIVAASE